MRRIVCLALFVTLAVSAPGWGGDGVVALQTADPSCGDDSGDRYVDCDNGTVTDNDTGLVWLANANCFGLRTWNEAMEMVEGLSDLPDEFCDEHFLEPDGCDCGLDDGSSPGEWRLPSIQEWKAMLEDAYDMGCREPVLTDDSGDRCWGIECFLNPRWNCSFYSVQSGEYWSSSRWVLGFDSAWIAVTTDGYIGTDARLESCHVWPVRGGQ